MLCKRSLKGSVFFNEADLTLTYLIAFLEIAPTEIHDEIFHSTIAQCLAEKYQARY